jgi:hypothetical protein
MSTERLKEGVMIKLTFRGAPDCVRAAGSGAGCQ